LEIRLGLLPKLPGTTTTGPVAASWKRARATGACPLPPPSSPSSPPLPTIKEEEEAASRLSASVPAVSAAGVLNAAAAAAGKGKWPCGGNGRSRTLGCCCSCSSRAPHVTSAGDASTAAAALGAGMLVDRRGAGVRASGLPSRRARMKMFACLFAQCPLPLCALPDSKVMCPCQIPWFRYGCSSPVCVCVCVFVCVLVSSVLQTHDRNGHKGGVYL